MPVTLMTASVLALIFLALCFAVVRRRATGTISIGTAKDHLLRDEDPKSEPLLVAVRSHANFAEYVPLSLVLLGLLEMHGWGHQITGALGATLIAARVLHPIGMTMKPPNLFRAGGIVLQWIVLLVMAVMGLWSAMMAFAVSV